MTDYDPKALSSEQQTELNLHKLIIRKENILYIRDHPEVAAIISLVLRQNIVHKPRNIVQFTAKLFSRPEKEIRNDVNAILNEKDVEYDYVPFCEYEAWDY
ncbi:hypothetical protein RUM44_003813 [Polyplax serrata]